MITIKGLHTISLNDYPGMISSVIFLGGCNVCCPYCFNMKTLHEAAEISAEEAMSRIGEVAHLIDGIVISGGEPLIYQEDDLRSLIRLLKERFKKPVKLNTNGTFPKKLRSLIDSKDVDFIAMDIKSSPAKLRWFGFKAGDAVKVYQSVQIIKESKLPHLFRTVLTNDELVEEQDLKWIRGVVGKSTWEVQKQVV